MNDIYTDVAARVGPVLVDGNGRKWVWNEQNEYLAHKEPGSKMVSRTLF